MNDFPAIEGGVKDGLGKIAIGLIAFFLFFELLAIVFGTPHLPKIFNGIYELCLQGKLQHDVAVSSARWLLGWSIGCIIGITLGLLTGRIKSISFSLEGLLTLFRAIPFISLVPLISLIFGLSETGKIGLVAWATAGTCWIIAHQSSKALHSQLIWRVRSLGVSKSKWIKSVLLPECENEIFTALRSALSLGLIVVAVAELSGVYERSTGLWWSEGLGYRLFRSLDASRDDYLLGTIFVFAALGILADAVFCLAWSIGKTLIRQIQRNSTMVAARQYEKLTSTGFAWADTKSLQVAGLSAGYRNNIVIHKLNLKVPAGFTMSIVGPSGCGKTTLLKALSSFGDSDFVSRGNITIGNNRPERSEVGIVMQDAPVFGHLTVWENITIGNRATGDKAFAECWQLLREFDLDQLAAERGDTLSGGQRQRLALATALANKPKLLLLDEPFGALDAITRRQLQHFYWKHVHGKVTALFVTHDLEESLLVADVVRVGIDGSCQTIVVDKKNLSPGEWELNVDFSKMRSDLLMLLQAAHPMTADF